MAEHMLVALRTLTIGFESTMLEKLNQPKIELHSCFGTKKNLQISTRLLKEKSISRLLGEEDNLEKY